MRDCYCSEEIQPCALCEGQVNQAHDEARASEGLRLALEFAELGHAVEVKDCDPTPLEAA